MNLFNLDLSWWFAVIGAALLRVFTSEKQSFLRSIIVVCAAVFVAYHFTAPVLDWLQLPPEIYNNPVAALLALTGEGIMRWIIGAANDPSKIFDLLRSWRGGGGSDKQ